MWSGKMSRVMEVAVAVSILLAVPNHGSSQIGFEKILTEVKSFGFGSSCWDFDDADLIAKDGGCEVGESIWLELGYDIGKFAFPWDKELRKDTTWSSTERTVGRRGREQSRKQAAKVRTDTKDRSYVDLQFALGYSQFTGFAATSEGATIRGQVRELPSATVYGIFRQKDLRWREDGVSLDFIGDVRTGFIQLHDVVGLREREDGAADTWNAKAQSFLLGAGVGARFRIEAAEVFGHVNWSWRTLPSVAWAGAGEKAVPAEFPREIDFSGRTVRFGVRYRIR